MTRTDIIQAAFKAWGKNFYHTTSLSDVSGELGVSKTALYRHFCSKQALLEAMYEWFLDDYTAKVKGEYQRAASIADPKEALVILINAIMHYYADNAYSFIFSLFYVYGERRLGSPQESLVKRGVDMRIFEELLKNAPSSLSIQLVFASFTFAMAYFHRLGPSERSAAGRAEPESQENQVIDKDISLVLCIIFNGLGFQKKEAAALDFGGLEEKVTSIGLHIEENKLLHSVAEAVAGAGPWGVSMGMVARISGLSKSGLYAHFKNKRDMLIQLFVTEFDRIINFAEESMKFSAAPAERIYLVIFAIGDYLRSRPDVLIAMDWLRTRRIDFSEPVESPTPSRLYRLFRDIQFSPEFGERFRDIEGDWIPAWILFSIVTSLMQCIWADKNKFIEWLSISKVSRRQIPREEFAKVPNETFRHLYRFIVRGIGDLAPRVQGC
jgi:AcrR family transcriptional regulator